MPNSGCVQDIKPIVGRIQANQVTSFMRVQWGKSQHPSYNAVAMASKESMDLHR